MEEIIKKAIEGGWKPEWVNEYEQCNFYDIVYHYGEYTENYHIVLLDPLFWQAIGKACVWGDENGIDDNNYYLGKIDYPEISEGKAFREVWQFHALRFHEINLTQGFDKAVEYLQTTLSPER